MSEAPSPSEVTGVDLELADPRADSICPDQKRKCTFVADAALHCIIYDKPYQSFMRALMPD